MKLRIEHETRYRFDAPVRGVIQAHRLWPGSFEGQNVLSWKVDTDGGVVGASYCDAAGDRISTVTWRTPVEEFAITVSGLVETADTSGVLRGFKERSVPAAYLRHTQQTYPDAALRTLCEEALEGMEEAGPLDRAHKLAACVAEAIEYALGETEPHTTAAEALALGKGVCQDHAHTLIALCHIAGIPARYVSGYLHAREDGAPHEASHAWAEVFIGGLGWVGFDAANGCCPDERYVRLGSGLDSLYAAPIRGIASGAASEDLNVRVTVAAQEQFQQQ
ncbi:transglutaminase family protein [Poseidonocella sedimentorum]|uniref:Transglutaminase-like enzyme, putative cysteine protease n=1 Tax=Poseidonocella sedimentorum TaxID=871652 RepID=A0A1I6EF58_9RHOB|nr:transglutaminase family protein [Poseidonocella sedimentorum]SFR16374.1 Transglutaminase-like enzyme, putative cysteine protease [Poseidonocella sedimentorum]